MTHYGAEFYRGDISESFDKADEVIDTNNIIFKTVKWLGDPGDYIGFRDISTNDDGKNDIKNVCEDSHDCMEGIKILSM